MSKFYEMTDREIAREIAMRMRAFRVNSAGMSQEALSRKSGVGTTSIKRFEKTGGATLGSLIAMLRAMNLLDRLEELIPAAQAPTPIEIFEAERGKKKPRVRAPRQVKHG